MAPWLAFTVTLILCPLMLVGLRRLQVVDAPGPRSSHTVPTPRGGGLAPAIGASVAALTSATLIGSTRTTLLVAAIAFATIGLAEDLFGVPVAARLALQVLAASLALPGLLSSFRGSRGWFLLFALGTLVWLVGYVNAFNFMDGINGLAVAQATLAGLAWYLIGRIEEVPVLASGSLVLVAAMLAFAPFNFPRARIFLGDVGSYFVGAWLAALAVLALRAGIPPEAVLAPLSLYLVDTTTTVARRVVKGHQWHAAHRDHVYQRLVQQGWSHSRTTAAVGLILILASGLGALSLQDSILLRSAADIALVGLLAGYLSIPRWLAHRGSRLAVA